MASLIVLGAGGQHGGEAGRHQQRHRDQPEQLAGARRHQPDSWPRSSVRSRSSASLRLRHSWSSTRLRRVLGIAPAGTPLAYLLLVEVDAEGQLVRDAAVERDEPGVVGADEVDLPRQRVQARADAGEHGQRDAASSRRRAQAPAPACGGGGRLGARSRRRDDRRVRRRRRRGSPPAPVGAGGGSGSASGRARPRGPRSPGAGRRSSRPRAAARRRRRRCRGGTSRP